MSRSGVILYALTVSMLILVVVLNQTKTKHRLVMVTELAKVNLILPYGWGIDGSTSAQDFTEESLWSPVFVDTKGRFLTVCVGRIGDTYWQYSAEFKAFTSPEVVTISGRSAEIRYADGQGFAIVVTGSRDVLDAKPSSAAYCILETTGDFSLSDARMIASHFSVEFAKASSHLPQEQPADP